MIFEDKVTIDAPADRVWAFLLDPNAIAACIPGVENVTRDDRGRPIGAPAATGVAKKPFPCVDAPA